MDLRLIAIGRMKTGPEMELLDRYAQRARKGGRAFGLRSFDIIDFPESRAANTSQRMNEEASRLASSLGDSPYIILDERGTAMSSDSFARLLKSEIDAGVQQMAFLIGGPDGLDDSIRQGAKSWLAFGTSTWPHQLVRVMLAEQIYRATTLWAGHPYHRS